ncbi:MAG: ABC transporter substrate-binding protein [Candidatus Rokuibacteriota bacterium]
MSHRVASLLPSATEIVCAVGAEAELVGISHECDFPESVRHLPALTRARLRPVRSSREIDREVRSVLQEALAVYEIELARLEEARPDVIVTQDLCDVCAVSFNDVCAATAALVHQPVRIVNLHPSRLDDIWADIVRVAEALGRATECAGVVADLQARISEITRRSLARTERPRVVSIEWLDPVMLGGMWMPELIERAGGVPLVTRPGDHAPTLTRDALRVLTPDVVLIKPCGFPLEHTIEEISLLRTSLPWESWRAVQDGRVYVADGNAYFNRPGPRIVESLEILAACLDPQAFADLRSKHRDSVIRLDADLKEHAF